MIRFTTQLRQGMFVILLAVCGLAAPVLAQGTAFTYQGKLTNAGVPATGVYDLRFQLFDALTGGTELGITFTNPTVTVTNGIFTVQVDFGPIAVFDGSARYLEIGVRPSGSLGGYAILSPRQQITATPYAFRASESTAADGLSAACVNCVLSGQIQDLDGAKITGQIPSASVPTGSGNYIQNAAAGGNGGIRAAQQAASFSIDGDGLIGGSLGVGTGGNPPATRLQVNGEVSIDAPVPVIHTAASGGEQNRFLHIINSPNVRSASGLKAGGVLVADTFGFADPGKNHLVVKGSIGIGTGVVDSSPKLVINGQNSMEIGGFEPFFTMLDTSEPAAISPTLYRIQAVKGYLGFNQRPVCTVTPCPSFRTPMVIDPNGNIGMGTTTPVLLSGGTGKLLSINAALNPGLALTNTGVGGNQFFLYSFTTGSAGGGSFRIFDASRGADRLVLDNNGNVGIGTASPTAMLQVAGTARTNILEITGGSDLAEHFELAENAKPGLVVAIDPRRPGKLALARGIYNRRVAGVISGANNLSAGMVLPDAAGATNSMPVALSGRVWVYCDASRHPIQPGNLLTTSHIPGHAMKVTNHSKAQGAIIGKAMTELKSGRGLVLVLVSLQ